jgi:dolichyl-phosphate-mannose--protein O-mannosyl transferase
MTILLMILILTAALGVRLYGITWGLPYEYHGDEVIIVSGALRFGTGDLNPHNFLYPSLLYYLLFSLYVIYAGIGLIAGRFQNVADVAVSYFVNPAMYYLIGRAFVALLGTATVGLVGIIGTRVYNTKVGIVAACFFAFTFGHVEYSHYAVTDAPMTFFVMLSFLFAVLIYLNGRRRDYILAGIFAGLAASTKYPGAAIMVALCTAHILRGIEQKRTLSAILFDSNIGLGVLLSIFAFFAASPFAILDFKTFTFSLSTQAVRT